MPTELNREESIEVRVQRGATLLDKKEPHWASLHLTSTPIYLNMLDMGDPNWCILGQRHFTYRGGLWKMRPFLMILKYVAFSDVGIEQWSRTHGFNRDWGKSDEEYTRLTQAWKQEIFKRRGLAPSSRERRSDIP